MSMLAALVRRYDRLAAKGDAPEFGYSEEYLHFVVVFDKKGKLLNLLDLRQTRGNQNKKAMRFRVPQPPSDRRGKKIVPGLFWDPAGYALGIPADANEKDREDARKKFEAFRVKHLNLLAEAKTDALIAFRNFLLAWDTAAIKEHAFYADMRKAQIGFRYDRSETSFIHETDEARRLISSERAPRNSDEAMCLATGEIGPIERLHPPIAGFPEADKIVSFNKSAFESYGKVQGANSPVSVRAAFAYTTALSGLLTNSRNRVQIGNASVVFWAEPEEGENANDFETQVVGLIGGEISAGLEVETVPDAITQERDLFSALALVAKGQPGPCLSINPKTKFYVLGLSPNAARISVRFWFDTTIQQLAERLTQHFEDLHLEPPAWREGKAPSIRNLIGHLSPMRQEKDGRLKIVFDDSPDHLTGELVRAVLFGGEYPYAILSTVLQRLKRDRIVTNLRVALVNAVLVRRVRKRGRQHSSCPEEAGMSVDPFAENIGRKLGRLFALYERAQAACSKQLNSSLVDKFFASAMATPLYVFPSLDANFKHHLAKIRKERDLAEWVKNPPGLANGLLIAVGTLSASIVCYPKQMSPEEQGQFVIGYYQQKFGRDARGLNAEVEISTAHGDQEAEL